MALTALRDDALTSTGDGYELRLGLPWIRSMPLSSVRELRVELDGIESPIEIGIGGRAVQPVDLAAETGWWFIQDRLLVRGRPAPMPGPHDLAVSFVLVVPYLQAAPGAPLSLPFHLARTLVLDAAPLAPTVARDVA